jgi:hypothetical protein
MISNCEYWQAGKLLFPCEHSFFNIPTFTLFFMFQVSHKINKLSFGQRFPGVVNPLDGAQWMQHSSYGMYQYFIKVVPTVYTDINEHIILSNQFSVTEHFRSSESGRIQAVPGVFFFYDLSPIKVSF